MLYPSVWIYFEALQSINSTYHSVKRTGNLMSDEDHQGEGCISLRNNFLFRLHASHAAHKCRAAEAHAHPRWGSSGLSESFSPRQWA